MVAMVTKVSQTWSSTIFYHGQYNLKVKAHVLEDVAFCFHELNYLNNIIHSQYA